MQNVLKASGMNMTPEVYQAYALVKSGAVLLGAIPCMFLFPLLVPVVVVLALLLYFKENQKADETLCKWFLSREDGEGWNATNWCILHLRILEMLSGM